jgi:NAD(P)-dependent dehydrogenase (short-subunit alcohol dehydrogenase family)
MKNYAIITGACGGIGQELVKAYCGAGYKVIAIDVKLTSNFSGEVTFLAYNVIDILRDEVAKSAVKNKIMEIVAAGKVKVLVNNAAVQIVKPIELITIQDWEQTLSVNLLSPFFWTQMFLSELESSSGSVLNISSIHARQTKKNFSVYATSKAGLSSLTKLMAIELGRRIRVNAIEPGAISTQMLEDGFKSLPGKRAELDRIQPMNRIGEPAEVAELAVFLTSDKAMFINGSVVTIDGGISNQLHDPN